MYDELNLKEHGTQWNERDVMAGFVGDVGDLSKIIMAKSGLRSMDNIEDKLKHELSDCLWSILVLADKYEIDLPQEFIKTMDSLESKVRSKLQ